MPAHPAQPDAAAMTRISTQRRWLALGVLAAAQFMVFLDESIVNVALPSIKTDLGYSQAGLAWVVNAYILAFGGLVLLGGRAADLLGRRRVFLAGIALFGATSLIAGLAPSSGVLDAARAAQGVGAALATPAALALVTDLFSEREERTKALGIWGALSGLGFAIGILLGGLLTQAASWRLVFLINIPVAAATIAAVPRLVPDSRLPEQPAFDARGALTVTIGLFALVFALLNLNDYGWDSPTIRAGLAVAAVLLAGFVAIELRSIAPLVPPAFLHRRSNLVPNALQFLLGASLPAAFFLLTLYLQQVLGYSPVRAGLAYLPLAAGVAAATAFANALVGRVGPRPLAATGLATAAAGLAVLGQAGATSAYATAVMPGLVLVGFGAGLSFVAITTAALARVDEAAAGLAAGVLSTSVQIGLSLGLAALVAISSARTTELAASGATPVAAEVGGIQLGFLVAAATAFAGSVTALVTLRGDRPGASASDEYRLDKRPPAREPKKEMKSHPSPEMAWKTPQRAGFVIQRTPARESRPSRGSRLPHVPNGADEKIVASPVRRRVSPFTLRARTVAVHRALFRLPHRLGQASVLTAVGLTPARDDPRARRSTARTLLLSPGGAVVRGGRSGAAGGRP
jgi:EmrB/QacA subfamily drug resistance transporter